MCAARNTALIFFFQAEDGIRDGHVTGVQTCALPISRACENDTDWFAFSVRSGLVTVTVTTKDTPVTVQLNSPGPTQVSQIGRASCREREWEAVGGAAVQKRCRERCRGGCACEDGRAS